MEWVCDADGFVTQSHKNTQGGLRFCSHHFGVVCRSWFDLTPVVVGPGAVDGVLHFSGQGCPWFASCLMFLG